jgi:5-hydroxyisourate hydrolase-like protein (transthyretin family)
MTRAEFPFQIPDRSRDREGAVVSFPFAGFLALAFALLGSLPALAAVDGRVINKTTGQPAAGVPVRLTSVGQDGMKPLGRAETAADGSFKFDVPAEGMFLLQANWQGVQYTQNLPPNAPKTGVEMVVYDVRAKLDAAKQAQHIVFLESDGQSLIATEMIIYANDSQYTWYDAKRGTARFFLPAGVKVEDVKAHVTAPGGLPLERELASGGEKGVYSVDYPVKPGESRFEVSYVAPKPAEFAGRILEPGVTARLVVPSGMEATGDDLQSLGKEPQSGAAIYELKKASFQVKVAGAGSLRAAQNSSQGQQEEDGPQIESIAPPGYDRNMIKVLVLSIAILVLGFAAMYLKGGVGSGRKA